MLWKNGKNPELYSSFTESVKKTFSSDDPFYMAVFTGAVRKMGQHGNSLQ